MLRVQQAARAGFPWSHSWGALNMNNLTSGTLWSFPAESPALAAGSAAIAWVPFPNLPGVLRHLSVVMRGAALAVDATYTVYVEAVATGLAVTIPAGQGSASISVDTNTAIPVGAANVIHVQFTCPAGPGSASTRPIANVSGIIIG